MCSDSNAAVRWSDLSEDKGFQFMRLEYTCTNVNGSVQYDQVNRVTIVGHEVGKSAMIYIWTLQSSHFIATEFRHMF